MALLQPGDLFPNGTASISFTSGSGITITPFSQSGDAYVVFETDLINYPNTTQYLEGATFTEKTNSLGDVVDGSGYRAGIFTYPGSSFVFTPSVDIPEGRVLIKSTGNIGLDVASFIGLLNLFPGAAAAYSLRKLDADYTGSAVEIRRDADNASSSFSFTSTGELDTSSILNFVNVTETLPADYGSGAAAAYSLRKVTEDSPVTTLPADYGNGASAAYSLRYVSEDYSSSVVEVRRSRDNASASFNPTEVTNGTLTSWVGPTNFAEWSEDFSEWDIISPGTTLTTGFDSPIETGSATLIQSDTSIGEHYRRDDVAEGGVYLNVGSYHTYAIWVKPSGSTRYVEVSMKNGTTDGECVFDFQTETFVGGIADYQHFETGSDGWYRIFNNWRRNAQSNHRAFVQLLDSNASASFMGSPDIGVYAFGAMVVPNIVTSSIGMGNYAPTEGGWSGFAYIKTWYDQSGNSNDATQSTNDNQPKIVDGGTLVTENGKPAINFDGVDDYFGFTSLALDDMLISSVQKIDTDASAIYNGASDYFRSRIGSYRTRINLATIDFLGATFQQQTLLSFQRVGSALDLFEDGVSLGSGSNSSTFNIDEIGGDAVSFLFQGNLQELIFYSSDQSSNRTAIESNQATFYGITLP